MEIFNLVVMLVFAGLAGLGIGYWWWERRLIRQKREYEAKIAQQVELLEKQHQDRIQQTVQSLRQDYEGQLRQQATDAERNYQQKLAETDHTLRQQFAVERQHFVKQLEAREVELQRSNISLSEYQTQLKQVRQRLGESEVQVDHMSHSLREYETQLGQVTQHLEVSKAQVQNMSHAMGEYDTQLQELSENTQATQAQVQARMGSLEQQHQTDIQQLRQNLEQVHEEQIETAVSGLEQQYHARIHQETDQLVRAMEQQSNGTAEAGSDFSSVLPQETTAKDSHPQLQPAEVLTVDYSAPQTATQPPQEPEEEITSPQEDVAAAVVSSGMIHSNSVHQNSHSRSELTAEIAATGNAAHLSAIPQLIGYAKHQDHHVREQLADTLGEIARVNSFRTEVKKALPTLIQLSHDHDPNVRQHAVEALGMIKSDQVIPVLQQALRDSNYAVVRSANAALNKFKSYPVKQKAQPQKLALKKPISR